MKLYSLRPIHLGRCNDILTSGIITGSFSSLPILG